jgi:hypothetical protein
MQNTFLLACMFLIGITMMSCHQKDKTLFTLTQPKETGITFENNVPYTEEFNTYTYRNFYNGGGVALGDINNDGWVDVFFSGNMAGNKLFLNKGNWKFEDITEKAGVYCGETWSTGATFADVNGDGLLDLYVCKAGKPDGAGRHNSLFINQGNLTFADKAKEYGLDVLGLSIHSAFFDYDRDGDLDCYVLNNSLRSVGGYDLKEGQRNEPDPDGNKLFRNEGDHFVNVTTEAGIYSSKIGYGLGITLSDFNLDGWTDLFISNDFFERDYLYYNQGDGTFVEKGEEAFSSMSMGSMGADACDINNDQLPDLFVTEMLPLTLERKKTKTQYETWDKYQSSVQKGYHHQFSRNVLQRNIGRGQFLEIGRFAGVSATEWSWASLVQDFNNDGQKDLFVSNGLFKDLLDKDYLNFSANANMIRSQIREGSKVLTMLIDSMPSHAVKNCMFQNEGNFHFTDVSDAWGLGTPSFSNGSAYGDLDNDGDLDLLVNNVNMPCFVYRNNTDTTSHRSIRIKLRGSGKNTFAVGAKVSAKCDKTWYTMEHFPSKGFQSCMESIVHLGVGSAKSIDSLTILWPDSKKTVHTNLLSNTTYTFGPEDGSEIKSGKMRQDTNVGCSQPFSFEHRDIDLNLFTRERLLIHMDGFDGPGLAVGDVNGDGTDDVFCGGGRNQGSTLFISNHLGVFSTVTEQFAEQARSEVTDAHFFDSDNDGDLDLYVAHGGKSFSLYAPELHDVLYMNDGNGNFSPKLSAFTFPIPIWTSSVTTADLNGDGLSDIVISEKMKTDMFGQTGSIYILYNQGENSFSVIQPKICQDIGMISDIQIADINRDNRPDIVLCGLWMGIHVILNDGKLFKTAGRLEIPHTKGMWHTLEVLDIDQDGDLDIMAGNSGQNGPYQQAWKMYLSDFDGNGSMEQIVCQSMDNRDFPVHDADEMFSQMPILRKKFIQYKRFASADMVELFGREALDRAQLFQLEETASCLFLQDGAVWLRQQLPDELQYSSIHSILSIKGKSGYNFFAGGNDFRVKPQFGRLDGSQGWQWQCKRTKDSLEFTQPIPLYVKGEIRKIARFKDDHIVFGINHRYLQVCKFK